MVCQLGGRGLKGINSNIIAVGSIHAILYIDNILYIMTLEGKK
jgi:hypothetical protein